MLEIQALKNRLPSLSAKDQSFATSLLKQFAQKGTLSDKQLYWVKKLAAPAQQALQLDHDLSGIVALFAKAGGKRPKITFATPDGLAFRMTVAGESSEAPGSISLTSADGDYMGREWFGRVHLDGRYEPSRKLDAEAATAIALALEAFALDPEGQSRAYGRRTGSCCYCSQELTDPVSVTLGYGPICAKRWGLPHTLAAMRQAEYAAANDANL